MASDFSNMMNMFKWLILIILAEALALYLIKKGVANKQTLYIVGGAIMYGCVVVPVLVKCLQFEGVGMTNFAWNIVSTIIGFIIGIMIFGETVKHLQVIGIVLSLVGIGLVILGTNKSIK